MNSNQERELKIMLTKEQYDLLLNSYDFEKPVVQRNIYFDTPEGFYRNRKGALRIRTIGQDQFVTLKLPKDSITKFEYEYPVQGHAESPYELGPAERNLLEQNDQALPDYLERIADFTTVRRNLNLEHAVLSLDETDFGYQKDYELEYEYKDQHDGISKLNQILEKAGIQYKKNGPSKIARAVSYNSNL